DPETRNWIFVEANARFWGSLPLAVASGVDFPRYLYEMLVEERTDFPKSYKYGVYCRNMRLDFYWFKTNINADRSDSTQQIVPLRQVFSEFGNILKFSERVDTFSFDDPLPFLTEIRHLANAAIGYLLRKILSFVRASAFFKHRRAKAISPQIKLARHVSFVCYGNICRSPFAEAYAGKIDPIYISFTSAGTFPKADRRVPTEAVVAAAKYGLDLTGHFSRVLSCEMIESSDLIFVFDRQNFEEVLRKFPSARSRIVELTDFLKTDDSEITDPFGELPNTFTDCYRKIAASLSNISRDCWSPPTDSDRSSAPQPIVR